MGIAKSVAKWTSTHFSSIVPANSY
ncbi:hypothetical protein HUI25_005407 [Escherichia coli]|nr:hypothetical protein [Escherichia coli]EFJ2843750.1 hypothetical protein [Escherichia coli]EFU2656006.1 hypothetical protein [Escherichia coli]EFU2703014.1 hypothetical protein [Escherichia coli]